MQSTVLTLMSIGRKLLLFCTLILKIVDMGYASFNCLRKMCNDLKIMCLAYCLVITEIVYKNNMSPGKIKVRFFNTDVYEQKQLLFCILTLQIVDRK